MASCRPPAGRRSGYSCLTEVGESGPTTNYDDVEDCQSDLEGEWIDWFIVIQWILTLIVVIMVKIIEFFFLPFFKFIYYLCT